MTVFPNWPNCLLSTSIVPLSPKNLRISAILVSLYQVMVAHVLMFVMLLGLAHAEEMSSLLQADIAEQKEKDWFEDMPTNAKGETLNSIRFNQASHLASITLAVLYIATGIASVYLISCLGLLIGTLKNKSEMMLPWLILDLIGAFLLVCVSITAYNDTIVNYAGGKLQYWFFCVGLTLSAIMIWFIVHAYYLNLRHIKKLTEVATVPIPCPAPGSQIPYYYRKENMHLGSNGYKHLLTESQANYVI